MPLAGDARRNNADVPHLKRRGCEQTTTGRKNRGIWKLAETGLSSSSSSDRLTEEQENEIAENIYDWWISGKAYKQWYAEKFQQMKLDLGEF
jgi:hypothetical protein